MNINWIRHIPAFKEFEFSIWQNFACIMIFAVDKNLASKNKLVTFSIIFRFDMDFMLQYSCSTFIKL